MWSSRRSDDEQGGCLAGPGGIPGFAVSQNPGIFETEVSECFVAMYWPPSKALLPCAPQKKFFTFSALVGPNITLFIDGKGTTCKDKYKYTNTKFVKDPMKYICENQDIKYKIPISLIPVF